MDNLLLTKDELNLLSKLIGQELKEVRFDGWSAQLFLEAISLSIQPDELYFPTDSNPNGDIVTLRINKIAKKGQQINEKAVLTNCGHILDILQLESLVKIENPRQVEAKEILGVEIPAGQGWSNNIYNPTNKTDKSNLHRTLLGLRFHTDKDDYFTFYSDAVGFFVRYQKGRELPKDLKDKCEKIEIKTPHNNGYKT